jgi:hypothetical protein
MKLQTLFHLALLVLTGAIHAALEPEFATDVKAEVRDENGLVVEGANVVLLFNHFQDSMSKKHESKTGKNGIVKATDRIVASLMVIANKDGFYPLRFDRVVIRTDVESKKIRNLDLPLVMRRMKSPVSLYAKRVSLKIPLQDQPVGFDFEVGDWVKPMGRGASSDVVFTYDKKFKGYRFDEERLDEMREFSKRSAAVNHQEWTEDTFKHVAGKWDGVLNLKFSNAKEGVVLVDKDFCSYSRLSMPHLAYEVGYEATWKREENTYSPRTTREGIGYFIRTRVKLDEKGEIVSANYAKLTSDLQFDPRGRIEFTYVFNPTPNDRNLEFDPHANRFKNLKDDERVMFP